MTFLYFYQQIILLLRMSCLTNKCLLCSFIPTFVFGPTDCSLRCRKTISKDTFCNNFILCDDVLCQDCSVYYRLCSKCGILLTEDNKALASVPEKLEEKIEMIEKHRKYFDSKRVDRIIRHPKKK